MTNDEDQEALTLSEDPRWKLALEQVKKKPAIWLSNTLGFFSNNVDALTILLAGDILTPDDDSRVAPVSGLSSVTRRVYFMQEFMLFLRSQLADRLVIDTISGLFSFSSEMTRRLLSEVLYIPVGEIYSSASSTPSPGTQRLPRTNMESMITGEGGGGGGDGSRGRGRGGGRGGDEGGDRSRGRNGRGQIYVPAIKVLGGIWPQKHDVTGHGNDFEGYLIPTLNSTYTFTATSPQKPPVLQADGVPVNFGSQEADPSRSGTWLTDPVSLTRGRLYPFKVSGVPTSSIGWKTTRSPSCAIPETSLLPSSAEDKVALVLSQLTRTGIIINTFDLSVDEILYMANSPIDFPEFETGIFSFRCWKQLLGYWELRNTLPKLANRSLLNFFKWASNLDDTTISLSRRIADLTLTEEGMIKKLLADSHFGWDDPKFFRNTTVLTQLKKACGLAAKVIFDVDVLFNWAQPVEDFWETHKIAEQIRGSIRGRYTVEAWESVAKPMRDKLRYNQREALIGYLLVQPELAQWGVVDADSLFEFFLTDVQMGPCLETSRIKQAISTVQLFVHRCLFGLEEKYGVPNGALDRKRWE